MVELVRRLGNLIKQLGEVDCEVMVQLDWVINDNTVLRPDIAITYNDTEEFISTPPVFIIEIVSPYTAFNDRKVKFEIYQEQGVPYYILVDPITAEYQIFVLSDGLYLQKNHVDTSEVYGKCSIHLNIADALREMNS